MHLIDSLTKNEGQVLVMVPEINLTPSWKIVFNLDFTPKKLSRCTVIYLNLTD